MFGSHLSIAGSMLNALSEATKLGMDTVQVFTKNQQQWQARPLDPALVRDWHAAADALGWLATPARTGRIVSHASYLANLASPDDTLWRRSIALMCDEVERCEQLGIALLVHHPGSFTTSDADRGMTRIAAAYAEIFKATPGYRTVCCLESTVGAGSILGDTFEELAEIRVRILQAAAAPERVAYCLDTCHLHAAGYDLRTRAQAQTHLDRFDQVCGLHLVRAWHLNDSKGPAGSKLDRHAHVGAGTITGGSPTQPATLVQLRNSGFAAVVNHPAFADVPKILETPKDPRPSGPPWDSVNLARLRAMLDKVAPDQLDLALLELDPAAPSASSLSVSASLGMSASQSPTRNRRITTPSVMSDTKVNPSQPLSAKPARQSTAGARTKSAPKRPAKSGETPSARASTGAAKQPAPAAGVKRAAKKKAAVPASRTSSRRGAAAKPSARRSPRRN